MQAVSQVCVCVYDCVCVYMTVWSSLSLPFRHTHTHTDWIGAVSSVDPLLGAAA